MSRFARPIPRLSLHDHHPRARDARLKGLDRALADGRDWLCAGRFTAADISVGYALLLARSLKIDSGFPPAVAAYWDRLRERDGFKRAKAAQKNDSVAAPQFPA